MKATAHLDPSPLFWSPRRAKSSEYLAQWSTRSYRTLMRMWNPLEISWPRPPLRFIILSPHVCSLPPQKYTTSSTSGTSPRYVLVDCNLRTIHILLYCSQVFQGLLRAHKEYHDTKNAMGRLWVHECFRVFSDRLVGEKDHETFVSLLSEKLGSLFDLTYHNLCPGRQPPIFGKYFNHAGSWLIIWLYWPSHLQLVLYSDSSHTKRKILTKLFSTHDWTY